MLTAIKGIFENGQITLMEKPPVSKRTEVIVTFVEETTDLPKKRQAGLLKGKVKMSEDFDDPLEDLGKTAQTNHPAFSLTFTEKPDETYFY